MNLAREFSEGVRISASAIFTNKLRSSLTALGIIIGILTVSLMAMAIEGMRQKFIRSISALGADVFYIEKFPWERTQAWWKIRNPSSKATAVKPRVIIGKSTRASWRFHG